MDHDVLHGGEALLDGIVGALCYRVGIYQPQLPINGYLGVHIYLVAEFARAQRVDAHHPCLLYTSMAPMAATYGKIVFLCLPMFMLTYVFEMFCSVAGKPGFGFLSSLTAGVVNIGLDAVLMGVFGMGIEGAATATCIAEYSSAMLMVFLFARGKVGVLKLVRPRWVQGVLPRSCLLYTSPRRPRRPVPSAFAASP